MAELLEIERDMLRERVHILNAEVHKLKIELHKSALAITRRNARIERLRARVDLESMPNARYENDTSWCAHCSGTRITVGIRTAYIHHVNCERPRAADG